MATDMSPEVLRLKEEGNALFLQKQYVQAVRKYTEALKIDSLNSVLYNNRSACYIHLGKSDEAYDDAKNAVFFDPGYTKAWVRFASLNEEREDWGKAATAWEEAMGTVTHPGRYPKAVGKLLDSAPGSHPNPDPNAPAKKLSPAEFELKRQYERRLVRATMKGAALAQAAAERQRGEILKRLNTVVKLPEWWGEPVIYREDRAVKYKGTEKWPWDRGINILEQPPANLPKGASAWTIGIAGKIFLAASKDIFAQANDRIPKRKDVCVRLADALLRERRTFHLYKGERWIEYYNKQVMFELKFYNGWPDSGPNVVLKEAQKRLEDSKDWQAVKKAIGITVSSWIINAHLAGYLVGDWVTAVQWHGNAVELIKAARRIWLQIWPNDGGDYRWHFCDNFYYLSVRELYMDAMLQANRNVPSGDSIFPISELLSIARELFLHEQAWRPKDGKDDDFPDPGFLISHCNHPRAEALAVKGYCYKRMAERLEGDERSDKTLLAYENYVNAAASYEIDDERHCLHIYRALSAVWPTAGHLASLHVTLIPIREIVRMLSHAKCVWEYGSTFTPGTPDYMGDEFTRFLKWAKNTEAEYMAGRLKESDICVPAWVKLYPKNEQRNKEKKSMLEKLMMDTI